MEIEFRERYVAFLDILGFKALLDDPGFKTKVVEYFNKIKAALQKSTENGTHGIYPEDAITYSVLSDSIILSIPIPNSGDWMAKIKSLRFLLSAIEKIQYTLALDNIWLRGAVSEGELSHNSSNVLGKGFVKAYLLEQKAVYPRVLVDAGIFKNIFAENDPDLVKSRKEVLTQINQTYRNSGYSGKFIFNWQDVLVINQFRQDYPYFVNYLNPLSKEDRIEERKIILKNLKTLLFANDPSVYEKYRWVCDYIRAIIITETNRRTKLERRKDDFSDELEKEEDFQKRKEIGYLDTFDSELSSL